jgi:hypothetical protein
MVGKISGAWAWSVLGLGAAPSLVRRQNGLRRMVILRRLTGNLSKGTIRTEIAQE